MKSTFDQFVIFSGFTSEMPTTRTHWFNYRNLFPMPQGALDPHLPTRALFAQLSMNHVTALTSTDATDADTPRDVAIVKKTVRPPVLDLSLDSGEAFTFKQPRKPCRIEEECAFGPIWALHSRRGKRRAHREDTFCAHPFYLQLSDNDPVSIFGVFDGHGGDHASRYTSKRLPVLFSSLLKKSENIRQALTNAFLIVDKELTEKSSPEKKAPKVNPAESFKRANSGGFLGSITLQRALSGSKSSAVSMEACSPQVFRRANSKAEEQISSVVASTHVACGTTATAVVLSRNKLIVAHVGDSRAVLSLRDGTAIRLSEDHRPTREDEKSRVEEAGGVFFDEKDPRSMRVDGILAITRAIGRPDLRSSVIPDPEVSVRVLDGEEDFFVIASDGLWDYVQDEECAAVVRDALGGDCMSVNETEGAAAKELVKLAWECGSTDDISVLVVNLERYRHSLNCFDGKRAKSLRRKADFENGRINSTARGAEGGEGGHEFRFNSTHDDDEGEAQLPLETPRYLPNRTHW